MSAHRIHRKPAASAEVCGGSWNIKPSFIRIGGNLELAVHEHGQAVD